MKDTSIADRAWVEVVNYLTEHGVNPARLHLPSVTVSGYQELQIPVKINGLTGKPMMRYRTWPESLDAAWLLAALALSKR